MILLRSATTPVGLALALVLAPGIVSAQVGHAPGRSPFQDIPKGHTVTAIGGLIQGSGGRFGIAPHDGTAFGIRYDIRTASAIQMGISVAQATLERVIVDPFVEVENRVSGPLDQTVTFAEFDLQFNVTGGKSWRRLAPFVGVGGGLTFAGRTAADTSGFNFGRKFYFAPHAGVRVFVTDRLHLRTEARLAFWKVQYPDSFTREPPLQPGTPSAPNAVIPDMRVSEWTATPWFQVGLAYSFSP